LGFEKEGISVAEANILQTIEGCEKADSGNNVQWFDVDSTD
jgi:hypothetical protein